VGNPWASAARFSARAVWIDQIVREYHQRLRPGGERLHRPGLLKAVGQPRVVSGELVESSAHTGVGVHVERRLALGEECRDPHSQRAAHNANVASARRARTCAPKEVDEVIDVRVGRRLQQSLREQVVDDALDRFTCHTALQRHLSSRPRPVEQPDYARELAGAALVAYDVRRRVPDTATELHDVWGVVDRRQPARDPEARVGVHRCALAPTRTLWTSAA